MHHRRDGEQQFIRGEDTEIRFNHRLRQGTDGRPSRGGKKSREGPTARRSTARRQQHEEGSEPCGGQLEVDTSRKAEDDEELLRLSAREAYPRWALRPTQALRRLGRNARSDFPVNMQSEGESTPP